MFVTAHTADDKLLLLRINKKDGEVVWTQEVGSGTLIDTRPDGHWDRVRNIIARRTYRPFWRSHEPLQ